MEYNTNWRDRYQLSVIKRIIFSISITLSHNCLRDIEFIEIFIGVTSNIDVYRKKMPLEIYAVVTPEVRYEVKEAC